MCTRTGLDVSKYKSLVTFMITRDITRNRDGEAVKHDVTNSRKIISIFPVNTAGSRRRILTTNSDTSSNSGV
jgi:hypothetical protein